jgi:hypothetical protein
MGQQVTVVTAPVALVAASASDTGDQIRSALATSQVVIADLTPTKEWDLSAVGELCQAHELAVVYKKELRIVVTSASIRPEFILAASEDELGIYPDLGAAMQPEMTCGPLLLTHQAEVGPVRPNLHARGTAASEAAIDHDDDSGPPPSATANSCIDHSK